MILRYLSLGMSLVVVLTLSIFVFLVQSGEDVGTKAEKLRHSSKVVDPKIQENYDRLLARARDKAWSYDYLLRRDHLEKGMVVNRRSTGQMTSECDSLLFSSLRYIALTKMGFEESARHAWSAITKSRRGKKWLRHPDCPRTNTSRDMLIGLLAALSQQPEKHQKIIKELLSTLKANDGYIGDGPFHVSRISFGIAEIIRLLAKGANIPEKNLSAHVRYGFSTLEFDIMGISRGYRSHLNALMMWTEYEVSQKTNQKQPTVQTRNLSSLFDKLTKPFSAKKLVDKRHQWMAYRMVDIDERNLFFRWLFLKSSDALTLKTKSELLEELLAMKEFPDNRLPADCDRKADYLWQRDSIEYDSIHPELCQESFSGVDFLWMVSLLH